MTPVNSCLFGDSFFSLIDFTIIILFINLEEIYTMHFTFKMYFLQYRAKLKCSLICEMCSECGQYKKFNVFIRDIIIFVMIPITIVIIIPIIIIIKYIYYCIYSQSLLPLTMCSL